MSDGGRTDDIGVTAVGGMVKERVHEVGGEGGWRKGAGGGDRVRVRMQVVLLLGQEGKEMEERRIKMRGSSLPSGLC